MIEFERLQTESPHKLNNKKIRCINYNVTLKQVDILWICHLSVKLGVHFSIQNNKSIQKKINKDIYLMHCSYWVVRKSTIYQIHASIILHEMDPYKSETHLM